MVQPRSKTIVIIAAAARNGVIGRNGQIPWHLPEDFAHFKSATLNQTVLMGRTTFESIGRPLPGRTTIVLTRDPAWRFAGTHVANNLQAGLDLAEDFSGDLIVAGGSHIYAEMLPHAQVQILSRIDAEPEGDASYPPWDEKEWLLRSEERRQGFSIQYYHRWSAPMQNFQFELSSDAAESWWDGDWTARLKRAVRSQQSRSNNPDRVDWKAVHYAAMRVIVEAAEQQMHPIEGSTSKSKRRIVQLSQHVSMQDAKEIQGALFHWSNYLAPRRSLAKRR